MLSASLYGQNPSLCHTDEAMAAYLDSFPEHQQSINVAVAEMHDFMQSSPQAIMNGDTYTIPVVFHVLHLGEAVGIGSNISNARMDQALQDLNDDFADVSNVGYDVGIQFCLAQQDSDGNSQYDALGNNITGYQRVDASGISDFSSFGLWSGVNEIDAKALSNWPQDDYLNIWIAHRLYLPPDDAAGYAYKPGAGDNVDGIALRADATGTAANSKVITHEAGHYFGLCHTFEDATNTNCPPNADCTSDGDMLCQTRPHRTFPSVPYPCDESLYTACDPSFSEPYLVTENHMNYTDNSCRDEFVPDQAMAMRAVLMTSRSSLMSSIGCMPGCETITPSFSSSEDNQIEEGTTVIFTNTTSIPATRYEWTIDANVTATSTDWVETFEQGGIYEICLLAYGNSTMGDTCIADTCFVLTVVPVCEPTLGCPVVNGDFEQIESDIGSALDFSDVCGWSTDFSSPFYCNSSENNYLGLFFLGQDQERVVTDYTIDFTQGSTYDICFEYLVSREAIDAIIVGYTDRISTFVSLENLDYSTIAEIDDPVEVSPHIGQVDNHNCIPDSILPDQWRRYCSTFTVEESESARVFITGRSISAPSTFALIFIDNFQIDCCEKGDAECPAPTFVWDTLCPSTFTATGDTTTGDLFWTFTCDGFTSDQHTVTRDFPAGSTCKVCLTRSCDQEQGPTTCLTVTSPDTCGTSCTDLSVTARACEQTDTTQNSYVATFDLVVPKGTVPCGDVPINATSAGGDISISSVLRSDGPAGQDIISIGVDITTPGGVDAVLAGITLCDTLGNIICYNLSFEGLTCTNCEDEITAVAICTDTDMTDDIYTWSGSVDLGIPGSFQSCPNNGTNEVGLSGSLSVVNNTYSYNFSITSTRAEGFSPSTVLCFIGTDGQEYCVTVNIEIEPCETLPTNCQTWAVKHMVCDDVVDGQAIFSLSMGDRLDMQWEPCAEGVTAVVEGPNGIIGSIGDIIYQPRTNRYFSFETTFSLPCDFHQGELYIVRLYLCNGEGEMWCWEFPLLLSCSEGCEELRGRSQNAASVEYTIYPNPATDQISIDSEVDLSNHKVVLYNLYGKPMLQYSLDRNADHTISISRLTPGTYIMSIVDDTGQRLHVQRIIIFD